MPRKSMDKVPVTPERIKLQKDMRTFLKTNSMIEWKELRPTGFQIHVGTIPDNLVSQFLGICYQTENKNKIE